MQPQESITSRLRKIRDLLSVAECPCGCEAYRRYHLEGVAKGLEFALNGPTIVVHVQNGRFTYTDRDLKDFLTDRELYKNADNLPKWLFIAGAVEGIKGFPTTYGEVFNLIQTWLNTDCEGSIHIDRSRRELNRISVRPLSL